MNQEISESDWEEIKEIAAEIANAAISEDSIFVESLRLKLLDKLASLEEKYGEHASLLGVIAEYIEMPDEKMSLFNRAYEIAEKQKDYLNLTLVSHSIAELYILEFKDEQNGARWLDKLESNLKTHYSSFEAEHLLALKVDLEKLRNPSFLEPQ